MPPESKIASGGVLLPSAAEEEGDGEIERQIQRNRRAGGAAEVIRRDKPEHGACERAENREQVVLAQIPREVPGRRGGQDEKGIDNHQAHPAHGERDDDGNADREERLRFLRRNAARGGKLRMHRRQETAGLPRKPTKAARPAAQARVFRFRPA